MPPPSDKADLAAEAFGQGRVTASPWQMALVAATVAGDGRWRQPRLVAGADGAGQAEPPKPLDAKVAATLRTLTRQVVTEGTAAPARFPGKVGGKTGMAEFGTGDLPTHAWFIGFRGDLGFLGGGRGRRRRRPGGRPGRGPVPGQPNGQGGAPP